MNSRRERQSRGGRPTGDQLKARQDTLIRTAQQVFLELGYDATSIDEIARRAKVSKQTIYSRYPTKADFFKAVIRQKADHMYRLLSRILDPNEATDTVLTRYGENLARVLFEQDAVRLVRTVIGASNSFPELAEFLYEIGNQQGRRPLAVYFATQVDKGSLELKDPMMAAYMFESLCVGHAPIMAAMGLKIPAGYSHVHQHMMEVVRIFLAAYGTAKTSHDCSENR